MNSAVPNVNRAGPKAGIPNKGALRCPAHKPFHGYLQCGGLVGDIAATQFSSNSLGSMDSCNTAQRQPCCARDLPGAHLHCMLLAGTAWCASANRYPVSRLKLVRTFLFCIRVM